MMILKLPGVVVKAHREFLRAALRVNPEGTYVLCMHNGMKK